MTRHDDNGLVYYTFGLLDRCGGIRHGASTRLGGVSEGCYRALNLGLHVGDDAKNVVENRKRFLGALGMDAARLVTARQVHGTRVTVVGDEDSGRGAFEHDTAVPGTDALVTSSLDLPVMILVADCVPILLYDPAKKVAGLAHGSWRGTMNGIGGATVAVMRDQFGSDPADMIACLGPSIGPCCYEVGGDVFELFSAVRARVVDEIFKKQENGKVKLDLWEANRLELIEAGVEPGNIEIAGICTSCKKDLFYSYRAEQGLTGRLGVALMLAR